MIQCPILKKYIDRRAANDNDAVCRRNIKSTVW